MAARPGRRPAGPAGTVLRWRGAADAPLPFLLLFFLLLLWFAAMRAAASSEPPPKCDELRLGQYMCDEPKIDNSTQEPMNCTNHTAYVQCLPAPNITCKDHLGVEKVFTGREVGFYKPIACRNVNGYSYKVAVALSLFLGWLGADRFYLGYPALAERPSCYHSFILLVIRYTFTVLTVLSVHGMMTNGLRRVYKSASFILSTMGAICRQWDLSATDRHSSSYWLFLGLLKFCTVGFCGIGSLIDFILISMQIVGPSDGSSYIIDYYGARLTRLTITNATFRKMQSYP